MVQEVRMRKKRHLIALVVFVTCTAIAFSHVLNRRNAVRQMFNDAGREGTPVVFIQYLTNIGHDYLIVSMEHDPIYLFINGLDLYSHYPFFNESGSLRIIGHSPSADAYKAWNVAFPEIHNRQFTNWTADYFLDYPEAELPVFSSSQSHMVWADLENFQIVNLETGEYEIYNFENPRPWSSIHTAQYSSEDYVLSPDRTVIVARERYSTDFLNIWRYDIPAGIWSRVTENQSRYLLSVGPEGNILGLGSSRSGQEDTIFINGVTGIRLYTVQNAVSSFIGERWILCQPYTGKSDLIFIDMEDNWQEYRITLPTDNVFRMAVYIPPPGGVEKMLRMREEMRE
jgi:hypothetical protein